MKWRIKTDYDFLSSLFTYSKFTIITTIAHFIKGRFRGNHVALSFSSPFCVLCLSCLLFISSLLPPEFYLSPAFSFSLYPFPPLFALCFGAFWKHDVQLGIFYKKKMKKCQRGEKKEKEKSVVFTITKFSKHNSLL